MKKYFTAYNFLLVFVFLLNVFAYLAPVLMHIGLEEVAKYIYFVYSFFCHQLDYRSLHIFDYQVAWCVRDTFIWFGLLVSGIAYKFIKTKPVKWYEVILFVMPIALDGGVQLLATMFGLGSDGHDVFYASTNFTRMLTGSILGIGLGMWIFPSLKEIEINSIPVHYQFAKMKLFAILLACLFVLYVGLVGVWDVTSKNYDPENILDSNVKLPYDESDWFIRRRHGYCPRSLEEGTFFLFECEEKSN